MYASSHFWNKSITGFCSLTMVTGKTMETEDKSSKWSWILGAWDTSCQVRERQEQRTHPRVFCPPCYGPLALRGPKETPDPRPQKFGWTELGWRCCLYERLVECCVQTGVWCPEWQSAALDLGHLVERWLIGWEEIFLFIGLQQVPNRRQRGAVGEGAVPQNA